MLQTEFEKLTGKTVTEELYVEIEKVYMACNLDKVAFCEDWKQRKLENSNIVWDLADRHEKVMRALAETKKQLDSLAVFLIEQAHKYGSVECRDKAISMVGVKDFLAYKLEHEMNLWADERVMMIEILKQK